MWRRSHAPLGVYPCADWDLAEPKVEWWLAHVPFGGCPDGGRDLVEGVAGGGWVVFRSVDICSGIWL